MKKVKAIPAIVMLVAGVITCLFSMKKMRYAALDSLIMLLAVLVIFYLIGSIARMIISSILKKVK